MRQRSGIRGGYSDQADYRERRATAERAQQKNSQKISEAKSISATPADKKPRKLSYKKSAGPGHPPRQTGSAEFEKVELEAAISDPKFYARPQAEVQAQLQRMTDLTSEIDAAYMRWTSWMGWRVDKLRYADQASA